MYKKLKLFRRIKSYEPWFNYGLLEDNSIVQLLTGKTFKNRIDLSRVISSREQVLFLDDLNRPYRFTPENDELDDTLSTRFRVSSVCQEYLIYYIKGDIRSYGIWNSKSEKVFCEVQSYIGKVIFDDSIYGEINNIITSRSINSGEKIWSLDISEIGYFEHPHENRRDKVSVQQFVGVYEQVLWVYLGNMVFLGIDVNCGEVLYKMDQVTSHVNADYSTERVGELLTLIWDAKWFLDKNTGLIKGLCNHCYIEIDLKKPAQESKGLISRLFNKKDFSDIYPNISVRHFYSKIRELGFKNVWGRNTTIDNNYTCIFFLSEEGVWGVYNTKKYAFEYISEAVASGESGRLLGLREIKQSGDKVYVLDQEKTLHIYEKE